MKWGDVIFGGFHPYLGKLRYIGIFHPICWSKLLPGTSPTNSRDSRSRSSWYLSWKMAGKQRSESAVVGDFVGGASASAWGLGLHFCGGKYKVNTGPLFGVNTWGIKYKVTELRFCSLFFFWFVFFVGRQKLYEGMDQLIDTFCGINWQTGRWTSQAN